MQITYNAEYERKLRAVFVGCGGHAVRNLYPTFQYAPVELIAVCDLDEQRARWCARQYGAHRTYPWFEDMFEQEQPEVVFACLNYDEEGKPRYPQVAMAAMQAGAHVWIEKPPASSSAEVKEMMAVSEATGKFTAVGFKKMFFPANVKAKDIISETGFGNIASITVRYPQSLPPLEDRNDAHKMKAFLDHIVHPHSLLRYLAGPLRSLFVERHPSGGAVVALRFVSGAVGSLLLAHGQSGMSPLERTEIIGAGRNVVVDNNCRVYDYRSGWPAGGYGRSDSYYEHEGEAPRFWEPEFSLGQLYNKGLFMLGYVPEIRYFCECALEARPPRRGNLEDALEMLRIVEAYCQPDGQRVGIVHD